jgi:RNA-dependent RNA polymerase
MVGMSAEPTSGWRAPRPAGPPSDHPIQRPFSRRPGPQLRIPSRDHSRQPQIPNLKQEYAWSKFPELTIKLRNLAPDTTTYDIYRNFKKHGTIVLIEMYEGRNGTKDGSGKIRFSPAPRYAFWMQRGSINRYEMRKENGHDRYICTVELDGGNKKRLFKVRSPINKTIEYDARMKLIPSSLHFGVMLGPESFMTMESVNAVPGNELSLVVDLLRNRLVATFVVDYKDPRNHGDMNYVSKSYVTEYERKNKYMFQIPFSQLKKIYRVDLSDSMISLVISLESPPAFYRKMEDEKSFHSNDNLLWSEFDTWYRQTDIVYDPYGLANLTIALHKDRPVIDIGMYASFLNSISC